MAKEMVLVDSWTSPKPTHISWKERASRVRWRAAHVRARDREGARGRDLWGELYVDNVHGCLKSTCLPGRPAPHMSAVYLVDGLPGGLLSTVVYP